MKMARDAKDRMYSRDQGGVTRWYIDLRHLGGCREGLIPEGEKKATSDWTQAVVLAAERLKEVAEADEKGQRAKVLLGTRREPAEGLRAFAAKHLVKKAKGGKVTTRWLEQTERQLEAAVEFFGEHRTLASIEVADVESYVEYLDARSNGRGGTLGLGSQRHYLNSLSNLYKRAQGRVVASGYNPVAGVMEKPVGDPDEAAWLEVSDSALLLESARTYRPDPDAHAAPVYPLIATFLLSGGRTSEVLGLELDDVSFQRQRITFRPNEWRRLKSKNSRRSVPLWPQLEEILRAYFADKEQRWWVGALGVPFPIRWRGEAHQGLPQGARRRGGSLRLAEGRDPLEDVPAHVLLGPATDARRGCACVAVHGEQGTRSRRALDDGAGLWSPGPSQTPLGGR